MTKFTPKQPPDRPQFPLLPPGNFEARVAFASYDQASTGTPYLSVEFEIVTPQEFTGRKAWANLYNTEAAAWKLAAFLNAINLAEADDVETEQLIGRRLTIVVRHSEDDSGQPRAEVVRFRRLPAPAVRT